METLDGIDISENQGYLSDDAFDSPIDFVIIRSCFGDDHIDIQALRNADLARAAGKLVGHYCFALPTLSSGPSQARFFLDSIPGLKPGEPLFLDMERAADDLDWWCDQFIRVIKDELGIPPLLYVNHDFLTAYGFGMVKAHNCGLWIAEPDNHPDEVTGNVTPWEFAAFKQYTFGGGELAGQPVDQDTFFGSREQFESYGLPRPADS